MEICGVSQDNAESLNCFSSRHCLIKKQNKFNFIWAGTMNSLVGLAWKLQWKWEWKWFSTWDTWATGLAHSEYIFQQLTSTVLNCFIRNDIIIQRKLTVIFIFSFLLFICPKCTAAIRKIQLVKAFAICISGCPLQRSNIVPNGYSKINEWSRNRSTRLTNFIECLFLCECMFWKEIYSFINIQSALIFGIFDNKISR